MVMMKTTGTCLGNASSTLLRVSRRRMRSLSRALSTGSLDAKFQFRCTQCGKCCTGKGGRVRVNAREREEISALLGVSTHELTTRFLTPQDNGGGSDGDEAEAGAAQWLIRQTDDDSQCIFLRGTKCSIYQGTHTTTALLSSAPALID
ncbi:hypothetical protein PINS_up009130 [Pythium insidiosum]|nr:hypothetical protein PINS_up009130 [Pythium insidiosum]